MSFVKSFGTEGFTAAAVVRLPDRLVFHHHCVAVFSFVVSGHVFLHVAFSVESFIANVALEGLLSGVNPLVAQNVSVRFEQRRAEAAFFLFLSWATVVDRARDGTFVTG